MDKRQLINDCDVSVTSSPAVKMVEVDAKQNAIPAGWKPGVQPSNVLTSGPSLSHPDSYASVYIAQPGGELPGAVNPELGDETFGNSFGNKAIRVAFIRKVYSILVAQLAVTVAIIALFIFQKDVKFYVRQSLPLYLSAYILFLVTYITLICCGKGLRRTFPWNFIFLGTFTLSFAYLAGVISAFNDSLIVILAMGITTVVCLAISLFAVQTKWDITGWGAYLCVASLVLFIFGISAVFMGIYARSDILQLVYAGAIAILFSLFLMYDTQQIVGGRKYELSSEEYIYGALQIYIDVMQIFLAILRLSRH